MTFGLKEISRLFGKKVNLYLFRYGDAPGAYYAYTDHTQTVTFSGITYQPVPISRGKIVSKGSMDKSTLEVRMALNVDLAELFRVYPPASVISLTIYQGHLNDPDNEFLIAWAGRVASAKRETPELVLSCEPIRTTLKRLGLRRNYQYSCPHVLYGPQCRASKAAGTFSATVASISGSTVTLAAGWTARPRTDFLAGMMEWVNDIGDTESRTIIRISGETYTLSGTTRDLAASDTVSMILGCSRDMEGCAMQNNIQNFGGCPFIPKKNPIGKTSIFN